jgi:hypothetical protein
MTRGSLGEVLPASVKAMFVTAGLNASPATNRIVWSAACGQTHAFDVPAT